MNQLTTQAIVLSRTDFGEADRIITMLTPDHGKLRLMAKGVRRVKSKLAGGIELFSVSDIVFIRGRGEIGTLISTRLQKHFSRIITDVNRTMLGYELIKQLNRATEDEPEAEYFSLLQKAFDALDETNILVDLIQAWFTAQLLKLAGHMPNLMTDDQGNELDPETSYTFNFDKMAFTSLVAGRFRANHIKFLRLLFSQNEPKAIAKVQGSSELTADVTPSLQTMRYTYLPGDSRRYLS